MSSSLDEAAKIEMSPKTFRVASSKVIKKFKSGQENETETVTNVKTNVCVFVGCGVRRQLKEKKLIKKKE
jgi:hypothetical protein